MRILRSRAGEVTVSVGISVGIVVGCVAIGITAGAYRVAKGVPAIHDVATDTADPPPYVALKAERDRSWNGSEYGGEAVAEKQRKAYPDIAPVGSALPPGEAFGRALEVARGMDWKVAGADAAEGRIEATDTTRTFRFKDDVVIRVRPGADGASRVDVRSASRFGWSDLGRNAERIREFTKRFAAAAAPAEAPATGASPGSPEASPPGASLPSRSSRTPGSG
jgi:uncharacterized protein (DUF1499 family)